MYVMFVCVRARVRVCLCVRVCICAYMCACVYVRMYVSVYVYVSVFELMGETACMNAGMSVKYIIGAILGNPYHLHFISSTRVPIILEHLQTPLSRLPSHRGHSALLAPQRSLYVEMFF